MFSPNANSYPYHFAFWRRYELPFSILFGSIWLVAAIAMPLYNKQLLGSPDAGGFHFPFTATALQLGGTLVVLSCYVLLETIYLFYRHRPSETVISRHLLAKILYLFIPAMCFAFNMCLGNLGLYLVPTDMHILLRSSELFFVIVVTSFVKAERPTWIEVVLCVLVAAGTFLLSVHHIFGHIGFINPIAMLLNIASAAASGAQISTLRWSIRRIERLQMSDPSVTQLAFIKLMIALPSVIILAAVTENWFGLDSRSASPFVTLWHPSMLWWILLLGLCLTLTFQTSAVAVAASSRAISWGLLSQFKVLPQLFLAVCLFPATNPLPSRWYNWLGAFLLLFASIAYGIYREWTRQHLASMMPPSQERAGMTGVTEEEEEQEDANEADEAVGLLSLNNSQSFSSIADVRSKSRQVSTSDQNWSSLSKKKNQQQYLSSASEDEDVDDEDDDDDLDDFDGDDAISHKTAAFEARITLPESPSW
jgi:hypothetical protein